MISEQTDRQLRLLDDIVEVGARALDPLSCILPEEAYSASAVNGDGERQVGREFRVIASGDRVTVLYNSRPAWRKERWKMVLDLPAKDVATARKYGSNIATALRVVGWE